MTDQRVNDFDVDFLSPISIFTVWSANFNIAQTGHFPTVFSR